MLRIQKNLPVPNRQVEQCNEVAVESIVQPFETLENVTRNAE